MKVSSLDELKKFIKNEIQPKIKKKTVVLLSGELGAGKTQFVKTFCELSKIQEVASSPTFSIIQEYSGPTGKIYHVDLYRLENAAEIEATGFWEIFEDLNSIIFIEWPEKINSVQIPSSWERFHVKISLNSIVRDIEVTYEPSTNRKN